MRLKERSSIFGAFMWMVFLSLLLCWIPIFGQFIAGFVGGKKAGSAGRGILAFFFPALIFSIFLIFLFPILPFISMPLMLMMVIYNFSLFCGAIVGGALA